MPRLSRIPGISTRESVRQRALEDTDIDRCQYFRQESSPIRQGYRPDREDFLRSCGRSDQWKDTRFTWIGNRNRENAEELEGYRFSTPPGYRPSSNYQSIQGNPKGRYKKTKSYA